MAHAGRTVCAQGRKLKTHVVAFAATGFEPKLPWLCGKEELLTWSPTEVVPDILCVKVVES